MKNVLVTGNEGYIGCILTEKLLERGYNITGFDLGIFRNASFVSKKGRPVKQIYKDIRDIQASDLEGFDAVIHLAALSNDPLGQINPKVTYGINCEASAKIARLAKATGVKKFLFSSSCSVYGVSEKEFIGEDSPPNPQTPYASSKIMAEEEISKLAGSGFCPIFLRNATVFGISPRMRLDLVVQNLLAYGYLYNQISILSDGTPWRPLIHIDDVAEAFLFLLEFPAEKVCGQSFNVGKNEDNLQIKAIARAIKAVIPEAKIEIKNQSPSDTRSYRVDFSKIKALGFEPKFTLQDGILQMKEAFKKAKLAKGALESVDFITLKKYQEMAAEGKIDKNFRLI